LCCVYSSPGAGGDGVWLSTVTVPFTLVIAVPIFVVVALAAYFPLWALSEIDPARALNGE